MSTWAGGYKVPLVLALAMALLLTACGDAPSATPDADATPRDGETTSPPDNGQPSDDDVLTVALFGRIESDMNPYGPQSRNRGLIENMYEPLVRLNPETLEIVGALAESWTVSDDRTTWTFELREGVNFHDGTPFEAEAVVASYDLLTEFGTSDVAPVLELIQEVRAVDTHTVEFIIDPTGFPFIDRLPGLSIASPTAIEEQGADAAWWGSNVVGTGPFILESYIPDDRVVMRRNDDWWGETPYFASVVFLVVPEASSQLLMLQRGEVDIAYNLPIDSLAQFEQDPDIEILNVPGDRVLNFRMNIRAEPLNNPTLRKTLAYAYDYQAIIDARQGEVGAPQGPAASLWMDGWVPDNVIQEQDLDRARELLAEAGYEPGDLTLDVSILQNDSKQRSAGEVLVASLAEIGVQVNLREADFFQTVAALHRYREDPVANADAAEGLDMFTVVRNPFVPHPFAYWSLYDPEQAFNFYGYTHPEAQDLFEQGHEAADREEALSLYQQAFELIVEDQPDIWPYVEQKIVAMRADLEGYTMNPTYFPETHVWNIRRRQ